MPSHLAPPTLPPARSDERTTGSPPHRVLGLVAAFAGLLLAVLIVLALVPRGLPPTSLHEFTGSRAFVEGGEDGPGPAGGER